MYIYIYIFNSSFIFLLLFLFIFCFSPGQSHSKNKSTLANGRPKDYDEGFVWALVEIYIGRIYVPDQFEKNRGNERRLRRREYSRNTREGCGGGYNVEIDWPYAWRRGGASTGLASGCCRTGRSPRSVPPIHKSRGLSIADHWSSICRPIIGKVPTKISNVSPQIIKHQRGRRMLTRGPFQYSLVFFS